MLVTVILLMLVFAGDSLIGLEQEGSTIGRFVEPTKQLARVHNAMSRGWISEEEGALEGGDRDETTHPREVSYSFSRFASVAIEGPSAM